jgi:hypothetical protein
MSRRSTRSGHRERAHADTPPGDSPPRPAATDPFPEPDRWRGMRRRAAPASSVVFALVTGLAVGFAAGREVSLRSGPVATSDGAASSIVTAAVAAKPAGAPAAAGCGEAEDQPSGPAYVQLAAWNPRIGPKDAKVSIVEFCDFQ